MWEGYSVEKIVGRMSEQNPVIAIEVLTEDYDLIIDLSNLLGLDFVEAFSHKLWISESERGACYEFFEEFNKNDAFEPFREDFICYMAENGSVIARSQKKKPIDVNFIAPEEEVVFEDEIEEDEKRFG